MSGGFCNGIFSAGVNYKLTTGVGITYPGTLLKKNATAGEVDVCGAGERPIGYAGKSTVDVFGTTQTACQISVMPLLKGNVVEVPVLATNAEISVGDRLETTAGGTVDLKASGGQIVGYALEHVAGTIGTGHYVKVLVDCELADS